MKNNISGYKCLPFSIIALSAWLWFNFTSLDSLAQQNLDHNFNIPSFKPATQSTNNIIPPETDDIRDIHNLVEIPYTWIPYAIILGSVIAFHLILFALYKWLKQRKRKKEASEMFYTHIYNTQSLLTYFLMKFHLNGWAATYS